MRQYIRRNSLAALLAVGMMLFLFNGCGKTTDPSDRDRITIVTTIFPYYDVIRVLTDNDPNVDVTMLVPAGKDSHSFEPTIQDMMLIQSAKLLIYNSELTESWITKVKTAAISKDRLDVAVTTGMTLDKSEHEEEEEAGHHHGEEGHAYEDHIWTSPKRMLSGVDVICDALCKVDPEHEAKYRANADAYKSKLRELDQSYETVIAAGKNKTLVFGDRFPFYYLCKDYGLTAHAAFDSCSSETEPSAGIMTKLSELIRQEHIPVVYHLEMSSEKIADALCAQTGAKKLLLHSCHTVTKQELADGVTYLSLMEQNLKNIEEGLGK